MKRLHPILLLGIAMTAAAPAFAEYPAKPVRVVIGFAPGGASDIAFRMVQDELSKRLGQPVVPDYKPGANGNIANDAVASAAPDGYTLLWANVGPLAVNQYLYANNKLDPAKAFAPVTQLTDSPLVVVVPKDSPYKTMGDLIAAARSGKPLTFGSAGNGSSMHIAGASLSIALNASMTHVPYKGSGPALTDLRGGVIDVLFDYMVSSTPHLQAGAIRALAVTGERRLAALPDTPTIAEAGYPQAQTTSWSGIFVPAGTPKPVVERLARSVEKALASDTVAAYARDYGSEPLIGLSQEKFGEFLREEVARWKTVVERANVQVE